MCRPSQTLRATFTKKFPPIVRPKRNLVDARTTNKSTLSKETRKSLCACGARKHAPSAPIFGLTSASNLQWDLYFLRRPTRAWMLFLRAAHSTTKRQFATKRHTVSMTLLLILAGSRLKLKTKMTTSHLCLIGFDYKHVESMQTRLKMGHHKMTSLYADYTTLPVSMSNRMHAKSTDGTLNVRAEPKRVCWTIWTPPTLN